MGSVSTSIRGVRFTLYILGGNEWVRFPRHSVSGSTWEMNGRGCLPPGVWIHLPLGDLGHMVWKGVRRRLRLVLAGAVLLHGFCLFGVALHREAKAHKRTIFPVGCGHQAKRNSGLLVILRHTKERTHKNFCFI